MTRCQADCALEVGLLLAAALDDHEHDLALLPLPQLDLHQLVPGLLEVQRAHNGQIDRPPQVDDIRLRLILYFHRRCILQHSIN